MFNRIDFNNLINELLNSNIQISINYSDLNNKISITKIERNCKVNNTLLIIIIDIDGHILLSTDINCKNINKKQIIKIIKNIYNIICNKKTILTLYREKSINYIN